MKKIVLFTLLFGLIVSCQKKTGEAEPQSGFGPQNLPD